MSETRVIPGSIIDWTVKQTSTAVEQLPEPVSIREEAVSVNRFEIKPQIKQDRVSTKARPVRPQVVAGFTTRYRYGEYGSVYVTMNYDIETNAPLEVFITSSQTSARNQAYTNVLARMISNQIKHGVPLNSIYKHMIGMDEGQPTFVKFPGEEKSMLIKSIPDLIGNVLRLFPTYDHLEKIVYDEAGLNNIEDVEDSMLEELTEEEEEELFADFGLLDEVAAEENTEESEEEEFHFDVGGCSFNNSKNCPDAQWKVEAGCDTCLTCGYSKCG